MFNVTDKIFQYKNTEHSTVFGANWQDINWYSNSYSLAFETLLSHCQKEKKHSQILLLPIIYIFRHYIEIKLKEISESLNLIDKEKIPNHRIDVLWKNIMECINETSEDFSIFSSFIDELSKLDSNSMNFRYPTDTKFQKSLEFKELDFENFISISNKIIYFLESLNDSIQL